jgi:hypothetical protein
MSGAKNRRATHPANVPENTPESIDVFCGAVLGSAQDQAAYTAMERYRDFRALFLSTEQGRRVLSEILKIGFVAKSTTQPGGPIDPYRTHLHEGRRTLAMDIFYHATVEPAATRPERANSRQVDSKP